MMGLLAIFIILLVRKISSRYPAVLISVVITTFISWYVKFELNYGGKVIGVVPDGLPSIQMPQIDLSQLINLGTVAIAISLIGFYGSHLNCKSNGYSNKTEIRC